MLIIPAIDILGGRCVRLREGDYATAGVVASDAIETARGFAAAGAEYIHIVDLDGAKAGRRVNHELIAEIAGAVCCAARIEVGGGIRCAEDMEWYISRGVERVILGSAAYKNPALVRESAARYGDKLAVGIDAREGLVATEGWTETSGMHYLEFARLMEQAGVRYAIVTDISRDGMLSGVNTGMLAMLKSATGLELTASGGVRDMDDIKALAELGIYGAIAGRAVYDGTLNLHEAVMYCVCKTGGWHGEDNGGWI